MFQLDYFIIDLYFDFESNIFIDAVGMEFKKQFVPGWKYCLRQDVAAKFLTNQWSTFITPISYLQPIMTVKLMCTPAVNIIIRDNIYLY